MNQTYPKRLLSFMLVVFTWLQATSQNYQVPNISSGHKHRGFYLSLAMGVNQTNVTVDSKNFGSSSYKGPGFGMDIKIGGTLSENLILHATILTHAVTGPKVNSDDFSFVEVKTDNKISLSESMIGAGLTYYTSDNFLLSSSVGFGGFTLTNEREDIDITTDNGISFQLKAGKEWWISRKWGLGVAVYYHHTSCLNQKGNFAEEQLDSNNFGIVFNATLNGRR